MSADTAGAPADARGVVDRLYRRLFGTSTQRTFLVVQSAAIVALCLFILVVPPATGYEPAVISRYPLSFWVAFGVGLASAILVFLGAAVTSSRYWRQAFVLLVCQYGLFSFLPVARGYKLYGRGSSDTLRHLGTIKTVVATGEVPGTFYPHIHLLAGEVASLGVGVDGVVYVVAFTFTMLFIGSVGVLVRDLVGDTRGLPLGLAVATPLMFRDFHLQIHPATLSFMLFPLVVLLVERIRRSTSRRYLALAVLCTFAIVFFHPVTTLLLIAFLLSTVVFSRLYPLVTGSDTARFRSTLALALLPAMFMWYLNFERTQNALTKVLVTGGQTPAAQQGEKAEEAVLTLGQLAYRFVTLYGTATIYFAIGGLFCLFVLYRLLRGRERPYAELFVAYQYTIGGVISVAFLVTYLIAFNPTRVTRYLALMAIIAVALAVWRQIDTPQPQASRRQVVVLVVLCSVVTAAILGGFTVYRPNKHMTQMEYEGTEFTLRYHDDDTPIRTLDSTPKMQAYVTGGTEMEFNGAQLDSKDPQHAVWPNLGYDGNETAAQSFGHSYLMTQQYDRRFYRADYFTERQQEKRRQTTYSAAALRRMTTDPTANKVYSSDGFGTWYVVPPQEPAGSEPAGGQASDGQEAGGT